MRPAIPTESSVKVIGLIFFVGLLIADGVFAFFLFRERFYPTLKIMDHRVYMPLTARSVEQTTPAVAEPTAVPTPLPTPAVTVYTVKSGDTLSQIAREFGVTVDDLLSSNQIEDKNRIYPGQELIIPGTATPEATPQPTVEATAYP